MGARQSRSTPCPAERQQQLLSLEVDRDFVMWLQPIVQLETSSWIGLEALARFPNFPGGPAAVFAEAADLQIGVELELKPDMLKLDGALVRDIDTLPDKQTMVRALTRFARDSDATVIAEQVEKAPELAMFNALNVTNAQGYHLTRPAPFDVLFPTTTPKFATV